MLNNRKIKFNSGFSLIEAVITTAIFGIIMIIIFSTSGTFFKAWRKHDEKQDINKEFVKIYSVLNKDIITSNIGYFVSYNYNNGVGSEVSKKNKWFCFPVPFDENGKLQVDGDGHIIWTEIIIYYLIQPDDDCTQDGDDQIYCPHKKLIRTVYSFESPSALNTINTPLDNLVTNIADVFRMPSSNFPPIAGLKFMNSKVLSDHILNLEINCEQSKGKIDFKLETLRIEDAKKAMEIGTYDFNSENGRKFVEAIGWSNFIEGKTET